MRPVQSASAPAVRTGRRPGHDPDRINTLCRDRVRVRFPLAHDQWTVSRVEARAVDEILR